MLVFTGEDLQLILIKLLLKFSSMEAAFHLSNFQQQKNELNMSVLKNVKKQVLLSTNNLGYISLRPSSIEVVFHFFNIVKIMLSSICVELQLLESKFC